MHTSTPKRDIMKLGSEAYRLALSVIKRQLHLIGGIALVACIAGSAAVMFGYAMSADVNCDENSYIASGVLLSQGKAMYRDFCYLQMPLLPIIYAGVFTLFKTHDYLFIGRTISFVCSFLTALLIANAFAHAFRKEQPGRKMIFSACGIALYSFNSIVLYTNSLAWNHALPIFCTTAACVILVRWRRPHLKWIFFAGFLCGIASITRLSFIVVAFSLFAALLLLIPTKPSLALKRTGISVVGMAVPFVIVCYYLITAFRPFVFDTFQYFMITGAHQLPGADYRIGLFDKMAGAMAVLKQPSNFILVVLVLCALGAVIGRISSKHKESASFIALAATVGALVSAFLVTPMWNQYFASLVPLALVFVAYGFAATIALERRRSGKWGNWLAVILIVCAIGCVAKGHPRMYRMAFSRKSWATNWVYDTSLKVASEIGCKKKVLTVAPMYALEGGNNIYPQFSAGFFLLRYSHLFAASQKMISVSVSPDTLEATLKNSPPDAVLVGFYPNKILDRSWTEAAGSEPVEYALVKFAVENHWRKVELKPSDILLYLPPRI